ncbi:MAG: carbon monoxide dehydrogenase subunit G [Anaerolineales bacterium]|nr:carbon monoxide dehydrogenase subunit G [Anaerolineales bacterium]
MQLEGTHLFAAPPQVVWEALMDPAVLAGALPGGEQLEMVGPDAYRAVMNVKVGPVQGRFDGSIVVSDIVPVESYKMKVDGQGAPGFLTGEGSLMLEDVDGSTLLRYSGDVQVGGRIAGVGQRLIESTAKSLTRQGLTALDQTIQLRVAAPAESRLETPAELASEPVATPPGSVQPAPARPVYGSVAQSSMVGVATEVTRDVIRDLASDYIPPDKQERVLYFGLGALAMLLFVILVRLVQRD